MGKLETLAKIEGFDDPLDMYQEYVIDCVSPGICMNDNCNYTTFVEPDSDSGWCEACETNTVRSAMILMGII